MIAVIYRLLNLKDRKLCLTKTILETLKKKDEATLAETFLNSCLKTNLNKRKVIKITQNQDKSEGKNF